MQLSSLQFYCDTLALPCYCRCASRGDRRCRTALPAGNFLLLSFSLPPQWLFAPHFCMCSLLPLSALRVCALLLLRCLRCCAVCAQTCSFFPQPVTGVAHSLHQKAAQHACRVQSIVNERAGMPPFWRCSSWAVTRSALPLSLSRCSDSLCTGRISFRRSISSRSVGGTVGQDSGGSKQLGRAARRHLSRTCGDA